jgi:two-component system, OmpR family, KDP operon response regulator KdpE
VRALGSGADDHVTKPFGVPELLARMRAPVCRRVTREGREVRLSAKEWSILEGLAVHAGKVVTHGRLLRQVWGRDGPTKQQYLRVYVRQLRQKLEPDPNRPQILVTEPGVGYRLLPDDPEAPPKAAGAAPG